MPAWSLKQCAHCGAEMEQATAGRPRRGYRERVTKVNRTGQDVSGHIIYQAAAVAPTLATAAPARKDGE